MSTACKSCGTLQGPFSRMAGMGALCRDTRACNERRSKSPRPVVLVTPAPPTPPAPARQEAA